MKLVALVLAVSIGISPAFAAAQDRGGGRQGGGGGRPAGGGGGGARPAPGGGGGARPGPAARPAPAIAQRPSGGFDMGGMTRPAPPPANRPNPGGGGGNAPARPPGNGNGNNRPPGNGNGNSRPPGNGNGNNRPPGNGNGNNRPPGNGNGNNRPPGNGNGNNRPPGNGYRPPARPPGYPGGYYGRPPYGGRPPTVVVRPGYVAGPAWGWNRGVVWYPTPNYWGGGFWGSLAIGVTSALVLGSIIDASTHTTYTSYQVQPNSPGATLLRNYNLTQVPCGPPGLVQIFGPDNSVICAQPNDLVAPGDYDLDAEQLTILSR